jgi:hypothetical protein
MQSGLFRYWNFIGDTVNSEMYVLHEMELVVLLSLL